MPSIFERGSQLVYAVAATIVVAAVPQIAAAQARRYEVQRGESRIQWVSDAPLERITGVNSAVHGSLQVDPQNLASARGTVHVDVAEMRTGIDLRDEHLRGPDWLDAGTHPRATLEITSVEGAAQLTPNEVQHVTLRGRFSLHGVTRDITARAQLRLIPATGDTPALIRAQASFDIELADYEISISAPVRLKVANQIRINVTIRAVAR